MNNHPTKTPNLVDDFLKSITGSKKTDEQKKSELEQRVKYNRALNTLYTTEYGEMVINNLVAYCHWDSVFNFNPEDRVLMQIQQEFVREMVLSRLTSDNLAKLLKTLRKGVN